METSLSTLQKQANAAQAQLEEAQGCIKGKYQRFRLSRFFVYRNLSSFFCSELRKAVADETVMKEDVQVVLTETQAKYGDLEQTIVAVC